MIQVSEASQLTIDIGKQLEGESLNEKAYCNMVQEFLKHGHKPSEVVLNSLKKVQETLTDMAIGKAEDCYFLCSLDPGIGKSTAIIKWIDVYLENPLRLGGAGVIIGLDRYDDIERYIDDAGIPEDSYSVLVSDNTKEGKELNKRGLSQAGINDAVILFTTKQQIKLRCDRKLFKAVEAFYYKNKPRDVRIWDESLIVGKELTLSRRDLGIILSPLGNKNRVLADTVETVMTELKDSKDRDIYQMPELGISLNDLLYSFKWPSKEPRDIAETLGILQGRVVTVRTDGKGQILVDCDEGLPNDFTPCLITDASGRVRETYQLQREYRGDIQEISSPECNKKYNPLTINVWQRGSGKNHYDREGVAVESEEIVTVIKSKPKEEFLIILHKEFKDRFEESIFNGLTPEERTLIHFLTYGLHTATNAYSEIPNIIVAGTLCYRVADYEAIARASSTRPTSEGVMTDNQIDRIKKGESAHHLLQAVCRGKVRKSEGDYCPSSEVWLITHPNTGIETLLPRIFQGCQVRPWKTKNIVLKGTKEKAYNFIVECLRSGEKEITASRIRKQLGITDKSNFKKTVLQNADSGHGEQLYRGMANTCET